MKKYIGTKSIMAEPMTMSEAYESKFLKEGVRPSECETDKAGYLVDFGYGYKVWVPSEPFEGAFIDAEPSLNRMSNEYNQLLQRYEKGDKYISRPKFSDVNYLPRMLFFAQHYTQREYLYLLSDRINSMEEKPLILNNFDFGTAIKFLKAGGAIRRASWSKDGTFIVKQVSACIKEDVIPNMQSLPQIAKSIIMERKQPQINYTNQMLIVYSDGRADSWLPTPSDLFAEDWELVTM